MLVARDARLQLFRTPNMFHWTTLQDYIPELLLLDYQFYSLIPINIILVLSPTM